MANRIYVLAIIVENPGSTAKINGLLSACGQYIVGRMGIPYKDRGISIICIVLDAPPDVVSTLSGKLGMLDGVSAKTIASKKEH